MSDFINRALETEWSPKFIQAMQDRMVVSFAKYGPIRAGYPHRIDAIASLKQRLDKYVASGNTEFLVDVANFAMIEFLLPRHVRAHFRGTDSNESPGRTTITGAVTSEPNEDAAVRRLRERTQRDGD